MIGLAARVWQHAGLAAATSDALVKLKAAGVTVDRAALDVVQPDAERRGAGLRAAVGRHAHPHAGRGSATAPPRPRRPRPGTCSPGAWCPTAAAGTSPATTPTAASPGSSGSPGSQGDVTPDGAAGSFEVPPGTDLRAMTRSLAPQPADRTAARAASAAAPRTACAGTPGAPRRVDGAGVPRAGNGSRRRTASTDAFADEVLGYGADVVVEAPPDVRESVVRRLRERRRGGGGVMSGARDQVGRLLALVPYIQARREVELEQAAADFGVSQAQIVKDLNVLWFCGMPGLGMGDLIDVDMDALEGEGVIRLSNAEYLTRPLRLDSSEASALIVALRALREGGDDDVRPIVDRTLDKLEAAAGEAASVAAQVDIRMPEQAGRLAELRERLTRAVEAAPAGAPGLLRAGPRRVHRAGGRPAAGGHRRRQHLPVGLLPPRRGPAAVPARPDLHRRGARHARSRSTPTSSPATSPTGSSSRRPTTCS